MQTESVSKPVFLLPLRKRPNMTNDEIIDLFDSTNITLGELSAITGRSVSELKNILMGE